MFLQHFTRVQKLPISVDQAWDFFSSPVNLQEMTPSSMGFLITSPEKFDRMYPGQIITYKVSPVLGIPLDWCTEITHVIKNEIFVDEQRFGPYAFWHHRHMFKEIENGVEMTDMVYYKMPMGIIGSMLNALFVKKQLTQIFDYRYAFLERRFGKL